MNDKFKDDLKRMEDLEKQIANNLNDKKLASQRNEVSGKVW